MNDATWTWLAVAGGRLDDWGSAVECTQPPFDVTGGPPSGGWQKAARFAVGDIERVFGARVGENDGENWLLAGALHDGRFFFVEAGCDYTGWDCRCWGTSWTSTSLHDLFTWALTDEARAAIPGVLAEVERRWPGRLR